ncbi:unnamed protein product [Trichobilharzia regenti]|nr:unnamed protein product [Trichobilharzia regenti]
MYKNVQSDLVCDKDTESNEDSSSSSDESEASENIVDTVKACSTPLPLGCYEVNVHPSLLGSSEVKKSNSLKVIIRVAPTSSGEENSQFCGITKDNQEKGSLLVQLYGYRLSYILDIIEPNHVVLYEPRVSWVRELEVYNARRSVHHYSKQESSNNICGDNNSLPPLTVHFMLYENSVEEQRYLTSLRKVEPMTLSIADYILSPHLCVERKSVSDLIGSLNSGRLFHQATAMSRHYASPVLLIEFSMPNKVSSVSHGSTRGFRSNEPIGFALYTGRHAINPSSEFNSHHLLSKLVLLTIHFPNLRLFWSMTPYCTAELFAEIKLGRPEPTVEKLPQDGDHLEDHNIEAVDMLLKLPGVSWKNYRRIMNHVSSLYDLVSCSLERLTEILDSSECATKLYTFLHLKCIDSMSSASTIVDDPSASVQSSNQPNKRKARLNLATSVKTRRGKGCGPIKQS